MSIPTPSAETSGQADNDAFLEAALQEFREKIQAATGRSVLPLELAAFRAQVATCIAHRQPRLVQLGLCDFQTRTGRATLIEVTF
ncbi:hypothetical protein [Pseudomonas sp. NBRC 111132]|uniref:hypothetical protein n=1 Tax=Pseudomonas sp. NBRC 111132 TaxID=1661047 RepID=UPI0007620F59|nr:hypothetical protein [Pseudomonas sp. NBRC 111132]